MSNVSLKAFKFNGVKVNYPFTETNEVVATITTVHPSQIQEPDTSSVFFNPYGVYGTSHPVTGNPMSTKLLGITENQELLELGIKIEEIEDVRSPNYIYIKPSVYEHVSNKQQGNNCHISTSLDSENPVLQLSANFVHQSPVHDEIRLTYLNNFGNTVSAAAGSYDNTGQLIINPWKRDHINKVYYTNVIVKISKSLFTKTPNLLKQIQFNFSKNGCISIPITEDFIDRVQNYDTDLICFNLVYSTKDPVIKNTVDDFTEIDEYRDTLLSHESELQTNLCRVDSNGETVTLKFSRKTRFEALFNDEILGATFETDTDGVIEISKRSVKFTVGGELVLIQKHNFDKQSRNKVWKYVIPDTTPPEIPVYRSSTPLVIYGSGTFGDTVYVEKDGVVIGSALVTGQGNFEVTVTGEQLKRGDTITLYAKDKALNKSEELVQVLDDLIDARQINVDSIDILKEG